MAYMNQEKKKEIAAMLKTIVPKDWKYSLRVRNHSTIIMTIRKGPAELLKGSEDAKGTTTVNGNNGGHVEYEDYLTINTYYLETRYTGEMLETLKKINAALNLNNHDNSDIMTDYFDVGHYTELQVGTWEKPYQIAE